MLAHPIFFALVVHDSDRLLCFFGALAKSLFITSEIDGDSLDPQDVIGAAFLLVVAGNDTTWSAIGSTLWHFAQRPEQRARLIAEPNLMPLAVEECLRLYAPTVLRRLVTKDTTYDDKYLSKGDQLMLFLIKYLRSVNAGAAQK